MKSKREILLFSLFMLCIVAFVAGGKKTDENKPSDDLVIEALVGIGPIKFGMSKDEITKYLGRPDKILGQGTELNYVSSRGLSFTVDAKSGMQTIKCWSDNWPTKLPFSVKTFTGKTKENIGMGATREKIIAAYGPPDRTDSKGAFENLHYDKLRTKFTLVQGKLASMILEAPK